MVMKQHIFMWFGGSLATLQICATLLLLKRNSRYVVTAGTAVRSRLRTLWGPKRGAEANDDKSFIEEEVTNRLRRRRSEMFRGWLGCASAGLSGLYMLQLVNNLGNLRWIPPGVDVIVAVFSVAVALAILFPITSSASCMPYVASFLYLLQILCVSYPACPPCFATRIDAWWFLPRTLMSICSMQGPLASLWCLVHLAAMSYNVASGEGLDCEIPSSIRETIMVALGRALLSCLLFLFFEQYSKEDIRRDIKSKLSLSELKAADSLMDIMCDVVVELDSEMRISKNAEKLAVVLFERPASVEGRHLKHFVHEEDENRLIDLMSRINGETDRNAQVFHLRVKDGQGNKISMEFFHVCFPHLLGVRHLIGLRELSDVTMPSSTRTAAGDAPPFHDVASMQPLPREARLSLPPQPSAMPQQVTVTVDAASFEILQCSQEFQAWFGEPPAKLTDWFRRPAGLEHEFQASYRRALAMFIEGFEEQGDQHDVGDIILQLPNPGQRRRRHYRARCAVTFFSLTTDKFTEFPGKVLAQLEFRGLEARARGGPSTASQSNSSLISLSRCNLGSARHPAATGTLAESTSVSL